MDLNKWPRQTDVKNHELFLGADDQYFGTVAPCVEYIKKNPFWILKQELKFLDCLPHGSF